MTSDNAGLRATIIAALVAAVVSAASIGIFLGMRGSGMEGTAVATDTQAIEKAVREYLIKNPEILVEMSQELEQRQTAAQEAAFRTAIAENDDVLFRSSLDYVAGNPQGDVTVVEFFDYNCGYCKRAMPDIVKLIESDSNVRVVFKEFPILRKESEEAARVALAAKAQGKYFEMHRALFEARGVASQDSALKIAGDLGLDVEKLKQDMDSPEVNKVINEARSLAQRLGVQGTPFFLIGDRVVPGAPDDLYEQLAAKVKEVRTDGCEAPVAC